jgi:hypothetical protein
MFSSASACTPNSQVYVTFLSSKNQILDITTAVDITVNGSLIEDRPISLLTGDSVIGTITTPSGYLGHDLYPYTLDDKQHCFAIVNKNNYHPTVTVDASRKKWYNYIPSDFLISFYHQGMIQQVYPGFGQGTIDVSKLHIILSPIDNSVFFYSSQNVLVCKAILPAGPIEYQKLITTYPNSSTIVYDAIILCNNKKLYRIRIDSNFKGSQEFTPTVIPISSLAPLYFEQDLPNGTTFIDASRRRFNSSIFPVVTTLAVHGTNIWLAGEGTLFLLTKDFILINKFIVVNEQILGMASIGNDVVITTKNNNAYYVSSTGVVTLIYQAAALGTPASCNGIVYLPDSNNQQIILLTDSSGTYQTIATPNFLPSYAREFEGKIWVTGHDSIKVLSIEGNQIINTISFTDKVTLVSVLQNSIIATHFLKDVVTLDLTGIKKIIPFTLDTLRGPISHIGTSPNVIKMLGQSSLIPICGTDLTCWVNGVADTIANNGDFVGVSYKATVNGTFRTVFILGDSAFDVDVVVSSSASMYDFFKANVSGSNALSGPLNPIYTPNIGTIDNGMTSNVDIGFNFSIYGTTYSSVSISTEGFWVMGNTASLEIPGITTDAFYVESGNLYQGLPINNVDPLNIGLGTLSNGETPGIYYITGTDGGFNYFRTRWVGTSNHYYPLGNTKITTTNIITSNVIPLMSTTGISSGDYISGNGIVLSSQVQSVVTKNETSIAYFGNISANFIAIKDISANIVPYSTAVSSVTGEIAYVTSTEWITTIGNIILAATNDSITVDGISSVQMNTGYKLNMVYYVPLDPHVNISDILSINYSVITLTAIIPTSISANIYVSESDFNSAYINQSIFGIAISGPHIITNKITSILPDLSIEYILQLDEAHTLHDGDEFSIESTVFGVEPGKSGQPGIPVNYVMNKVSLTNPITILSPTDIIHFYGNFAIVDNIQTISSNTDILFKASVPAPAYTYEVGIYVGAKYQYVEFYYDSATHSKTNPVGIINSSTNYAVANAAPNSSIVFGSLTTDGIWQYLGTGSFISSYQGYIPKNVRASRIPAYFDTEARFELVFGQHVRSLSPVLIALSYGYLEVNNGEYNGTYTPSEDDIINITVPFNNSSRPVATILSIGDFQIAIPAIPERLL